MKRKQKNSSQAGYSWQELWRIGILLLLFVLTLASILFNVVLTQAFGFAITLYGALLGIRKIAQWIFAYLYNRSTMKLIRTPILEALKEILEPDTFESIYSLVANKHIPFDDFRELIKRELSWNQVRWMRFYRATFPDNAPTVSVTAPIFGLAQQEVTDFVDSILNQTYMPEKVYMVLNGTIKVGGKDVVDKKMWRHVKSQASRANRVLGKDVFLPMYRKEGDKRNAMFAGMSLSIKAGYDLTANVDGDTILDPDTIANAVRLFMLKPDVVCATGDVRLINPNINLLTMLTAVRYFNAFNIERAAQSFFGQMTVLSGPFFIIRTANLADIINDWVLQMFAGKKCTYGDDRHMTTLAIMHGWKSVFISECIVWTEAPTKMLRWMKQQLRWSRSAWRENYILTRPGKEGEKSGISQLKWFILLDLLYLTAFPFLVVGVIVAVALRAGNAWMYEGVDVAVRIVLPYVITVLAVNWIFNSAYGLNLQRKWIFLLSPLYIILWFFILIPLKYWAAITIRDTGWSGRSSEGV